MANQASWRRPTPRAAQSIRMCIDRYLPDDIMIAAAQRAVRENPSNYPALVGVHEMRRTPMGMAIVTQKKWENGRTLKVAFMDGSAQQRKMVTDNAPEWCEFANINFAFGQPVSVADLRVSFAQQGAWSFIGGDAMSIPRNQPTMNFGFIDPATVLHEFGHALGCIHEHQHPKGGIPWNKPKVYQYYGGPPNNWDRATIDSNIFQTYSVNITQFSAYDRKSIMHYPIDRQLVLDPAAAVGWNKVLSDTDKAYIAQVYPGRTTKIDPVLPPVGVTIPISGRFATTQSGGKTIVTYEAG